MLNQRAALFAAGAARRQFIRFQSRPSSTGSSGNGNVNHELNESLGIDLSGSTTSSYIHHTAEHAPKSRRPSMVYNENRERLRLRSVGGGKVDLDVNDETGIALLTLNHPEKHNAFSGSMIVDLKDIVTQLEKWKAGKGLILRGSPEIHSFCSGADLDLARTLNSSSSGVQMCLYMHNTLSRLNRLPLIILALLEGNTLGGGAELATACDFRLMTTDARIQFLQVKMGVTPGWGGGARLVQLVGPQVALKMLASGRSVAAEEAVGLGLVDHVVEGSGGEALGQAQDWLKEFTGGPAQVVRCVKRVVLAGKELPLDEALKREKDSFGQVWAGPDHREAMEKLGMPFYSD